MNILTFYLIGFAIALAWVTHDIYIFNVRNNKRIFNDPTDIEVIFLVAFGSWLSVICLLLDIDDK